MGGPGSAAALGLWWWRLGPIDGGDGGDVGGDFGGVEGSWPGRGAQMLGRSGGDMEPGSVPPLGHRPVQSAAMDLLRLQAEPLSLDTAFAHVTDPSAGGVVVFVGTVRDDATRLEYEAYEEQAEGVMAKVAAEVRAEVPDVVRLAILHRHGDLAVGELAVVVAASAPHRAEAFTAARLAIDLVKQRVPIWKKEHRPDGTAEWVACHIAVGPSIA